MNKRKRSRKIATLLFVMTLLVIAGVFVLSVFLTDRFNRRVHQYTGTGDTLFTTADNKDARVSVRVEPRSSTWSKCIDYYNKGLEGHNYQAYTFDFYIRNNTKDEVSDYTFKFTFDREVYLMSAWNGALELHQKTESGEYSATVPDLREFHKDDFNFDTVTVDGKGYPEGKKGEEIPLIARMICVADSFDAMNSNRVYRKKLTKEDITNEIEKNKGTQFDPKIADIFLKLIKEGKI